VGTVPSTTVDEGVSAADHPGQRLWWLALAGGLVACAVYAVLPVRLVALRELVIYTLVELGAVAAVVVGVRRYQPAAPAAWLLIGGGMLAFTAGDVLWGVFEVIGRDPFPSAADAFYLTGYPLLVGGFWIAIGRRAPRADVRALIDAAIVAVGAGLVAWVYLIGPYRDAGLSEFETLVSSAYPIADVLLVAVAARFLFDGGWKVRSVRVLQLGLLLMLVADTVFAVDVLTPIAEYTRLVDTVLLVSMVLLGTAALDPSMRALTAEVSVRPSETGAARLTALISACLIPWVVLLVQIVRGADLYLAVTIGAIALVATLLAARFADITAGARRAASRETTLSRFSAELLRCGGRDELISVAERTATELAGRGNARVVEPPSQDRQASDTHAFSASVEVRGEKVAELVADPDTARLHAVRASLVTVARQLSLALDRESLLTAEREAADRLGEQNERLRELDRMKDQFVSSVSHELRTPLTSMVGYLELVLEGDAGELNDEQRRFLEVVNRNCDRLNRLVDDILFVARVDAGRLSLKRERVDVAALARDAVESAGAAAERSGVAIDLVADEDPHRRLWADPTRLAQLLDNLVSNAVKFTPEGGTITVTVADRADGIHLEVEDTGVGIPEGEQSRLFERFFRASTAAVARGTGLGLSIVQSIVQAHDGTIAVQSAEGRGTTFLVDLPAQAPTEAAAGVGASEEVAT
jgi:signal transduction histidine kinase